MRWLVVGLLALCVCLLGYQAGTAGSVREARDWIAWTFLVAFDGPIAAWLLALRLDAWGTLKRWLDERDEHQRELRRVDKLRGKITTAEADRRARLERGRT